MLISTTITNSRADVIGAALATVAPEVDACIVIDTGATDNTMQIARDVLGPKFIGAYWPWRNDFAAARNFALAAARDWIPLEKRFDSWIITADTDEWLRIPGAHDFLATVPRDQDVVMVPHATRTYKQGRCIRATAQGQWHMPVHEYFAPYAPAAAAPSWEFACQPRPDEDKPAKYEHYRRVLEALVEREPENPRAWYYLGDTLGILGYRGSAIKAFATCAHLPGWPDQAAWACYRAALMMVELGLLEHATKTALAGIHKSPKLPELHWLAGWIMYHMGDFAAAAAMAESALKIGRSDRAGFSCPPAQKEWPEGLLAHARAQLAGTPLAEPLIPAMRRAPG